MCLWAWTHEGMVVVVVDGVWFRGRTGVRLVAARMVLAEKRVWECSEVERRFMTKEVGPCAPAITAVGMYVSEVK